ncbi:MAG TPA: type II toxin-antitoxin system VapC family toxin [Acidimicrobiales bacterium]|nr:type II toxin-antitoxin system VapC family toxin [Acidimicrobiales bacterium]
MVDASVLMLALGEDTPKGVRARVRLRGERLTAPEIIDLETLSAWRRYVLAGTMSVDRAHMAVRLLRRIPLRRAPHKYLIERSWELRHNVTPYDAAYVALAEIYGVPLLTADAALAAAPGPTCQFELLH